MPYCFANHLLHSLLAALSLQHGVVVLLVFWMWRLQPSEAYKQYQWMPDVVHAGADCSDETSSLESLPRLDDRVPEATLEERERFLKARKGNPDKAAHALLHYLDWRTTYEQQLPQQRSHQSRSGDADHEDWNWATQCAQVLKKEPVLRPLPRVIRMHTLHDGQPACDLQGRRMVHILPGLMDERLSALQTYALAVAIYLDRKLPRDSLEQMTVLIDLRGGRGWRNLHAVQLLSFIQSATLLLLALFPERLGRALLYPLPQSCAWAWHVVRRCLDVVTRDKMVVLTGPATIVAPPPTQQLEWHVHPNVVALLEQERRAEYVVVRS